MSSIASNDAPDTRTDLDSHADSPVVGRNALVFETSNTTVQVKGFTPSLGSKTVPIVNAAIAYDDLFNNKIIILIIYNALYVKDMEHNLIPPFVMRLAQLKLDKEPCQKPNAGASLYVLPAHQYQVTL